MLTEKQIRTGIANLTGDALVRYILDLQEEARSEGWQNGYDEGHSNGYEEGERVYY
jgi:hypothetical protein